MATYGDDLCAACGKRLVVDGVRDRDHKCDKHRKRKPKRETPEQEFCRRLRDGWRMLGND